MSVARLLALCDHDLCAIDGICQKICNIFLTDAKAYPHPLKISKDILLI